MEIEKRAINVRVDGSSEEHSTGTDLHRKIPINSKKQKHW